MSQVRVKVDESHTYGVEMELTSVQNIHDIAHAITVAGVHCEVESYNHQTRTHWKIVSDASINTTYPRRGLELVSPPLTGKAGIRQLETVCKVLAELGVKSNDSCGVHIHHDIADLNLAGWKTLAKSYVKYEETLDSLMKWSRRANNNGRTGHTNYCRSMVKDHATVADMFRIVENALCVEDFRSIFMGRYNKLNYQSFWKYGTVEFRHHHGSASFIEIAAWVSVTQGLVNRARKGSPVTLKPIPAGKGVDSLVIAASLTDSLKETLKRRVQRLSTQTAPANARW